MVSRETSICSRWVAALVGALLLASCGGSAPPPPPPPPLAGPDADAESESMQAPADEVQDAAPIPFVFGVDLDTVQAGIFDQGKMWTFEFPPVDYIEETHGFRPDEAPKRESRRARSPRKHRPRATRRSGRRRRRARATSVARERSSPADRHADIAPHSRLRRSDHQPEPTTTWRSTRRPSASGRDHLQGDIDRRQQTRLAGPTRPGDTPAIPSGSVIAR